MAGRRTTIWSLAAACVVGCGDPAGKDATDTELLPHTEVSGEAPPDTDTTADSESPAEALADHPDALPLEGGHELSCVACHASEPEYAGLDPACASCHALDAPFPHFSGACDQCHAAFGWSGAAVEHSFPLPHGAVTECSNCHGDANDYTTFQCIECHGHAETSMSAAHSGVASYGWTTPQCYACHPEGRQ